MIVKLASAVPTPTPSTAPAAGAPSSGSPTAPPMALRARRAAIAGALRVASRQAARAAVNCKFDTGMGRLGCELGNARRVLERIRSMPEIRITGLMTHLACADDEDIDSVRVQLGRFEGVSTMTRELGFAPDVRHAANSAALFRCPESHFDWVRPGIALFGVAPRFGHPVDLRPAMTIRTEVVSVRELKKGEAIGYGWTWRAPRARRIAT